MMPYSAFAGLNPALQNQFGNQIAAAQAAQQYAPQIPIYQGPVANMQPGVMQPPQMPHPGQGMPATNSVLSQVPGLLKALQSGNQMPATAQNVSNYALSGGQGNPGLYGSPSFWQMLLNGGASPYAGMGAPT